MSTPATTQAPDEQLVNPSVAVERQVNRYIERGTLVLPVDYSASNALKQAWLALQEIEDKDRRKVIVNGQVNTNVVTYASVINALTDMVVQGLSVGKKQCYLIVYGNQLTCQRSYFGDEMLAMRVSEIPLEPYSQVIYEGDQFEFTFMRGKKMVTNHVSSLANQNKKVVGAYHGFLNERTGEDLGAVIMTMEEIQKSWSKSKTYRPAGEGGPGSATPHNQFTGEMCIRTVTRKDCKKYINASTDAMLLQAIRRQDIDEAESEMAAEVADKANKGPIITMPPMVAPALPEGEEPVNLQPVDQREPEMAGAPVSPAAPATKAAPVDEETPEEEEAPETLPEAQKPQEAPKAAIPPKKREPAPAAEQAPPKQLMLSQAEHMQVSDRLAALPGAPGTTEFIAECRQAGITNWAQVAAKLDQMESEAAGY